MINWLKNQVLFSIKKIFDLPALDSSCLDLAYL
jgi:hypothetical protein